MSRLAAGNGDDHPEAARKHLQDASILLAAGRHDGSRYLCGYVVETSLKTLWLFETGVPAGKMPWGRQGHDLPQLLSSVASLVAMAGAKIARYVGPSVLGLSAASICGWKPDQRYWAPKASKAEADDYQATADAVYAESVAKMFLDGVL